ncbi:MAG: substrate-binding domain-containing protein [Spirochaetales bacterium]|nr:substrate-binding domain-containing protein [Spirochaetales bacterium]
MKDRQSETQSACDGKYRIGLLGTNLFFENPINILRAAKLFARQQGHRLVYFSAEALRSPFGSDEQSNILYDLANPEIIDGLIVLSNILVSFVPVEEFRQRFLKFSNLPIINMGIPLKGIPSIVLDNTSAMVDLVSHLIENHGFSRIAYIGGVSHHSDSIERLQAFKEALKSHSVPLDETVLIQGNFQFYSGSLAVNELLDKRGKKPGKDFQVIVCANDYMAAGAMLELQKRGISVPDEVAITGFDNINFCECLSPPLCTVCYPFKQMTELAMNYMIDRIQGKAVPELTKVKPVFMASGSCGCAYCSSSVIMPAFVPENIQSADSRSPLEFTSQFNHQIIHSVNPMLTLWREALIGLREENKWQLMAEDQSEGEASQEHWSVHLLAKLACNTFNSANYQNLLFNMSSALTSTLELSELMEILKGLLPRAQINKFCLCLYDSPDKSSAGFPDKSKVILAFNKHNYIDLPAEGILFDTKSLLPGKIRSSFEDVDWVVLALYFKERQLGYFLLDSDSHHENLHRNLRNQISSAIMGARLLDETQKANELLIEANKQKTQFFINVAHETKTPLTLIKNYLSLYMEEHLPDQNLTIINENIELLLANMMNFLDVEKLQRGETIYQHDRIVDLSDYTQKKCALFSGLAKRKYIQIRTKIHEKIYIKIDPWALDRVLNNLLDNAVKYVQTEGHVDVKIYKKQDKAFLEIRDNGPGLSVDTYEHIFEPYYLMSRQKTSKQGMGVGLSIVKKILDSLGSEIQVSSNEEGGLCFTISFDLSEIAGQAELSQKTMVSASAMGLHPDLSESEYSKDRPTLLVVDDNIQLLYFMQVSLEKDYNVFLAQSVSEALFNLKTNPRPDLIIADIMMDGEDGYELLSQISAMESFRDIPFIFLTAISGAQARIKGLSLGALDYVEKPFSITEIKAKIDSHILYKNRQRSRHFDYLKNKIEDVFNHLDTSGEVNSRIDVEAVCRKFALTGRKPVILKLLLEGFLHKQIASELNITLRTVEYHIASIYKRMGVTSKYELVSKFQNEISL